MDRIRTAVGLATLILGFGLAAGCQNFDLRRRIPWPTGREKRTEQPLKIVSTWVDAVRHQPGRPPTRGFGGRVFFYGTDEEKPIEVKGRIVVYAFDETAGDSTKAMPDRKYVFPAEHVPKLCSESPIGPAYSIWVPWDDAGGVQKRISLLVRFEPADGPFIVGNQMTSVLPGQPSADPQSAVVNSATAPVGAGIPGGVADAQVEPVGFVDEPAAPAPRPRMTTTTIALGSRVNWPGPAAQFEDHKQALSRAVASGASDEATDRVKASRPATLPPARAPVPRGADSAPERRPAPAAPASRPGFGRASWPQFPAASPFGSPIPPRAVRPVGTARFGESARSVPR